MNNEFLSFGIELAKEAGSLILPFTGKKIEQNDKTSKDIVTEMDYKAENLIVNRIQEQFPYHNIYSEEVGHVKGNSEYEWVIDPIDGTVNYSVGLPLFGVSIALTYQNKPIVAVITLPALDETFWAAKGEGAFLNGEKLKIENKSLQSSFVSFADFAKDNNQEINEKRLNVMRKIVNHVYRIRMIGTAAVTLPYIAAGRLHVGIYFNSTEWYDIAAGQLILTEAGGDVSQMSGCTVFSNQEALKEIEDIL